MQELGRIGDRLRSGDLDEWGVRGVRTAHRRAAGDIESRIAGWPEEAKQHLPEQWIKQMGQLRRVQGWLESGQVKDEETEQLYQKAIAELEKALPVIRRLGLAEPSTNL